LTVTDESCELVERRGRNASRSLPHLRVAAGAGLVSVGELADEGQVVLRDLQEVGDDLAGVVDLGLQPLVRGELRDDVRHLHVVEVLALLPLAHLELLAERQHAQDGRAGDGELALAADDLPLRDVLDRLLLVAELDRDLLAVAEGVALGPGEVGVREPDLDDVGQVHVLPDADVDDLLHDPDVRGRPLDQQLELRGDLLLRADDGLALLFGHAGASGSDSGSLAHAGASQRRQLQQPQGSGRSAGRQAPERERHPAVVSLRAASPTCATPR
jgi:hypothetical protein